MAYDGVVASKEVGYLEFYEFSAVALLGTEGDRLGDLFERDFGVSRDNVIEGRVARLESRADVEAHHAECLGEDDVETTTAVD